MARKIKIPAKAPAPSPDDLLPHARLTWGRLAVTRRGADLWALSRAMKLRAQADGASNPLAFGVRALHPLDAHTQLVVVGVAGAASPQRFDAPRLENGVITRAVPVVRAIFWVGYFSDETPAEETVRGGLEELVASPAWRDVDARLVGAGAPQMPRVEDAGADDLGEAPDDPLRDACWVLSREHAEGEAAVVYGRMVPGEGDTYAAARIRTLRRATAEGDVVRVIGVPMVTLAAGERAVGLRYAPQSEAGEAWRRGAEAALQATLTGSYVSDAWLLGPEGA